MKISASDYSWPMVIGETMYRVGVLWMLVKILKAVAT